MGGQLELNGLKTQLAGGIDIVDGIIDQDAIRGRAADPFQQQQEDGRVRLGQLHFARNDDVVEPGEELKLWTDFTPFLPGQLLSP